MPSLLHLRRRENILVRVFVSASLNENLISTREVVVVVFDVFLVAIHESTVSITHKLDDNVPLEGEGA